MLNPCFLEPPHLDFGGLAVISTPGLKPGTAYRMDGVIYRPEVAWSEKPSNPRRLTEWLIGWAEMPKLWEGMD
jgi:hypothetical protein